MANAAAGAIVATATAGQFNAITGGTGTDTIIGSAAAATLNAVNLTTVTGIEVFQTGVAAAGNEWTFSGAAMSGVVNYNNIATDVAVGNFVGNNLTIVNSNVAPVATAVSATGDNQIDTVTLGTGTAAATLTTNFEVVNTTAAGSTIVLTGAAGGTQTVTAGGALTDITLSAAQQTVNLATGTAAGADEVTLAASNTIANIATVDTINGFAFGVDNLDVAAAGANTYNINLGAATTVASFAADAQAALVAVAGYAAAAGNGILVTVAAGSALAGTYVISDTTGNGIEVTDQIVKLAGTTGVFNAAADLI